MLELLVILSNLLQATSSVVGAALLTCSVPLLDHLDFDFLSRHSCDFVIPLNWKLQEVSLVRNPSAAALNLSVPTGWIRLLEYHYRANQSSCVRFVVQFSVPRRSVWMQIQCDGSNLLKIELDDDKQENYQPSMFFPIQECIPFAGYTIRMRNGSFADKSRTEDSGAEWFIGLDLIQFANSLQSLQCNCDNWTIPARQLSTCWDIMVHNEPNPAELEMRYEQAPFNRVVFVVILIFCSSLVMAACW